MKKFLTLALFVFLLLSANVAHAGAIRFVAKHVSHAAVVSVKATVNVGTAVSKAVYKAAW